MARLMRSHDWTQTPLGSPVHWSQSLRSTLSICLNSRFPIAIYWGADHVLLYNDAWRPIVGDKHPWALGRPGREVWSEIWDDIGAELAGVLASGEGTFHKDDLLSMRRFGYTEECFFEYTFNPIQGESGVVEGVFNVVTETTYRVLSERRARLLREVAAKTGVAKTAEASCALVLEALRSDPLDIPFALLYLVDPEATYAHLCGSTELISDRSICPVRINLIEEDGSDEWLITRAVQTAQSQVLLDLPTRFGQLPGSPWTESPQEALVLPIAIPGHSHVTGVLVAVASPRRRLDDLYHDFLNQVAGQVAVAIANARAYEEERKRAEALAELDQAKTTFFSNVSHEFRTPLTLMLNPLEDALASLETWEQGKAGEEERGRVQEHLQIAYRNSQRLLKLVNTLLDFSRIEAGRIEAVYQPTDLATLTADLAGVFRSAIEHAGLRLQVDCPPLPEPAYVDREMWEKIVLNLLSNAFKFTLKGEIRVSLRWLEAGARKNTDAHSPAPIPSPPSIELEICDTGTGIPADELPHIFERFHRVKGAIGRSYEGSGIGLSLVQELVKLHSGTIQVSSIVDQGTCFTVSIPTGSAHLPSELINPTRTLTATTTGALPYVEEALRWLPGGETGSGGAGEGGSVDEHSPTHPLTDPSPHSPIPSSLHPPKILLADDNADMRDYLKRLLSQQYQVEAVVDGIAALTAIRQQMPDLVLTDVMMPGMDGFEVLRSLRADPTTQDIPIILLSARAGEEARIEGLAAGADDYLTKPFSARELLARVEVNLKLAHLRREATQREQALRLAAEVTQQKLEVLLASISDGFYTLDRNWRFTYVNDRVCAMAGKLREELLGYPSWDVFPEAIGTDAYIEMQRAMHDRVAVEFEYLHTPHNRWFEHRVYPSPDGLTVFVADVTDRKRQELNAHFLANVTQDLTRSVNVDDLFQTIGDKIRHYFGFSILTFAEFDDTANRAQIIYNSRNAEVPDAIGEYRLTDFLTDTQIEQLTAGRVVAIKDVSMLELAGGDIAYQPFQVRSTVVAPYIKEGRLQLIFAGNRNTPSDWQIDEIDLVQELAARIWIRIERARIEADLRRSEAEFRVISNAAPALVWVGAQDGSVTFFNDRWYEFTGQTEAEAVGFGWANTLHPDDAAQILPYWEHCRQTGEPYEGEVRYRCHDGKYCWHAFRALPRRSEAGEIEAWYGLSVDISDRKQAEAEREQLLVREQAAREAAESANRIKDEFLAIVSHELRSPLNPILGWSKLLRTRQLNAEKTDRALEVIERNAQMQAQLINDLLYVSRILRGKLSLDTKPVNLVTTIQAAMETVHLAAEAKAIELRFAVNNEVHQSPSSHPPIQVIGDAGRLQQIVWNLLTNAVKFTPEGGRVEVSLVTGPQSLVQPGQITSEPEPITNCAQITITDTGQGIPADFLPYVFEQFRQESSATTRRFGGLGLGLAIVRYLVELHGGTVQADSPGEGQGSTFTVKLPLLRSERTEAQGSKEKRSCISVPPVSFADLRILIVDDDDNTREFLTFLLELHGANVSATATADAALTTLTQFKPDVLLSDIGMPDVDGYMLMRQVRALPPEQGGTTPAIALSAYAGEINYQEAMAAGFQQHIAKPVEPEVLIRAIVKLAHLKTNTST
ncbi:MAG: ATP-binding protein [Leptolyngbyaceae cyanobacterium bins.302]|nr:ATP-binding protein [Leptolyngbyaceae cyanobacterium bins.302]